MSVFNISAIRNEFGDLLRSIIDDTDVQIATDLVDDTIKKGIAYYFDGLNRENILADQGLESVSFSVFVLSKSRENTDKMLEVLLTELPNYGTAHIQKCYINRMADVEFNPYEDQFYTTQLGITAYINRH